MVVVAGGVCRSPCSRSGVKSDAIGIVLGIELHSSLHENSESAVDESWTCRISMCMSSESLFDAN